jgi:hypothetical protein
METARPVRAVLNRSPATPTANAHVPATEQYRIEDPSNPANPAPQSAPGTHTSHATPNPQPPPGAHQTHSDRLRTAPTGRTVSRATQPGISCQANGPGLTGRKHTRAFPRLHRLPTPPLRTSHFPLPTSHFPLLTSHFSLLTSHCPLPTAHCPLHSRHSHSTRTTPTSPLDLIQISPIRPIRPITSCNHQWTPKNSTGSHRRTAHPLRRARRVNSHMAPACRQHHRSIHTPANSVLLGQWTQPAGERREVLKRELFKL